MSTVAENVPIAARAAGQSRWRNWCWWRNTEVVTPLCPE